MVPASGPISIIWSAFYIVSVSCSTTITVLPKSLNLLRALISFTLSFWCKPIDGSSSTYNTPVRPDPIWDANLILCPSPPESVAAGRLRFKYSSPTLIKNPILFESSFKTSLAINFWFLLKFDSRL